MALEKYLRSSKKQLTESDQQRARELIKLGAEALDQACKKRSPEACQDLAVRYDEGISLPRDPVKARDYLKRACDLKDLWSCARSGQVLRQDGQAERANAQFQIACSDGGLEACFALGPLRLKRGGLEGSVSGYERACELGSIEACSFAAGEQKDAAEDARLYERACLLGKVETCLMIGAEDFTPTFSKEKRLQFLQQACQLGDALGCGKETKLRIELGQKPSKEAGERTIWLLTVACGAEGRFPADPYACEILGDFYAEGIFVPKSSREADRHWKLGPSPE